MIYTITSKYELGGRYKVYFRGSNKTLALAILRMYETWGYQVILTETIK